MSGLCSFFFLSWSWFRRISAAQHLSPDVSFFHLCGVACGRNGICQYHALAQAKLFAINRPLKKCPNIFYTSFGIEMDGTKQGRKKSIERSEKEELFVLQSGHVSSVGNPDRQADFCKQGKRTQSRATVGCIVQVCRFLPCTWSMQGKKEPLHWKQTTAWTSFASLSQNKTAAVCGS